MMIEEEILMLSQVDLWLQQNQASIEQLGYDLEVSRSPSDVAKPSISIDLESDTIIARITMWASGECQMEAIDVASESRLIDRYLQLHNAAELDKAFQTLLQTISGSSAPLRQMLA